MSSVCHVPGNDTAQDASFDSCNYLCVLENAREACREALAELYGEQLSRPEYWVGRLGFLMEYLLAATEPDD
jgi:hypothetical protein